MMIVLKRSHSRRNLNATDFVVAFVAGAAAMIATRTATTVSFTPSLPIIQQQQRQQHRYRHRVGSGSSSSSSSDGLQFQLLQLRLAPDGPAGSFFHPVPDDDDDNSNDGVDGDHDDNNNSNNKDGDGPDHKYDSKDVTGDSNSTVASADNNKNTKKKNESSPSGFDDDALLDLLRRRNKPPRASRPSTINGIPTEKVNGFGKQPKTPSSSSKNKSSSPSKKPYIEIGSDATVTSVSSGNGGGGGRINDPSKPEVDDQGYTLYTNEETGEKKRVFDALVEYPCKFTLKIVGANEGTFVQDIVGLVADACDVPFSDIEHSTKAMGKWTSITVEAPVDSAVMLYSLYEKVDLDPRVKFKF